MTFIFEWVELPGRGEDRFDENGICLNPVWPYPDDLPDLRPDPMNWTPEELALMGEWAREILFFDPIL